MQKTISILIVVVLLATFYSTATAQSDKWCIEYNFASGANGFTGNGFTRVGGIGWTLDSGQTAANIVGDIGANATILGVSMDYSYSFLTTGDITPNTFFVEVGGVVAYADTTNFVSELDTVTAEANNGYGRTVSVFINNADRFESGAFTTVAAIRVYGRGGGIVSACNGETSLPAPEGFPTPPPEGTVCSTITLNFVWNFESSSNGGWVGASTVSPVNTWLPNTGGGWVSRDIGGRDYMHIYYAFSQPVTLKSFSARFSAPSGGNSDANGAYMLAANSLVSNATPHVFYNNPRVGVSGDFTVTGAVAGTGVSNIYTLNILADVVTSNIYRVEYATAVIEACSGFNTAGATGYATNTPTPTATPTNTPSPTPTILATATTPPYYWMCEINWVNPAVPPSFTLDSYYGVNTAPTWIDGTGIRGAWINGNTSAVEIDYPLSGEYTITGIGFDYGTGGSFIGNATTGYDYISLNLAGNGVNSGTGNNYSTVDQFTWGSGVRTLDIFFSAVQADGVGIRLLNGRQHVEFYEMRLYGLGAVPSECSAEFVTPSPTPGAGTPATQTPTTTPSPTGTPFGTPSAPTPFPSASPTYTLDTSCQFEDASFNNPTVHWAMTGSVSSYQGSLIFGDGGSIEQLVGIELPMFLSMPVRIYDDGGTPDDGTVTINWQLENGLNVVQDSGSLVVDEADIVGGEYVFTDEFTASGTLFFTATVDLVNVTSIQMMSVCASGEEQQGGNSGTPTGGSEGEQGGGSGSGWAACGDVIPRPAWNDGIGAWLSWFWDLISQFLWCNIVQLIRTIIDYIIAIIRWLPQTISHIMAWFGEALMPYIAAWLRNIWLQIQNLWEMLARFIVIAWEYIQKLWTAAGQFFATAWRWMQQLWAVISNFASLADAEPQPINGVPQCGTAPLDYQICAVWYLLDNTIFAKTTGQGVFYAMVAMLNLVVISFFVDLALAIISELKGVTRR